jgi:hypothetical protein
MATKANILIDQGSTYTTDLNLTDENDNTALMIAKSMDKNNKITENNYYMN